MTTPCSPEDAGTNNGRRVLQLPPTPERAHYVRATVRVHEYPDGALAIFHGPRRLADYTPDGSLITPNGEPKTSQQAA
jgi:hypothetical protein